MNIRYKSLTIRDATSADSVQLAAWWNSGRIMAHAGFPNGLKTTAEKIASDISNSTGCHRLILEQYGKPIGEASYRTVPAEADESEQQPGSSAAAAEIGIKICRLYKTGTGSGKNLSDNADKRTLSPWLCKNRFGHEPAQQTCSACL